MDAGAPGPPTSAIVAGSGVRAWAVARQPPAARDAGVVGGTIQAVSSASATPPAA